MRWHVDRERWLIEIFVTHRSGSLSLPQRNRFGFLQNRRLALLGVNGAGDQDYSTVGQNPLFFTRYYNSMSVPDTYAVASGSNWRHNFDRYLHIINPSAIYGAIAERETGQYVSFSSSSGIYTSDTDLDYSLSKSGIDLDADRRPTTRLRPTASRGPRRRSAASSCATATRRRCTTRAGKLTSRDGHLRPHARPHLYRQPSDRPDDAGLANLTYGYVAFSSGEHLLSTVTYNTSPATHHDLRLRQHQLPVRADRHHRRERPPLRDLDL